MTILTNDWSPFYHCSRVVGLRARNTAGLKAERMICVGTGV